VAGVDFQVIRQRQQHLEQARVQPPRLAGGLFLAQQIGPPDVADEERVAGEDEPRLLGAGAVADQQAEALGRVAGGVEDPHEVVAQLDLLAIAERYEREGHRGGLVQVDGCAGRGRQRASAGRMVGVDVRLEDGGDRRAVALGLPQVIRHERGVRVADGQLIAAEAAEQVGGAAARVI
jgi:hypothetical protein